MSRRPCRGRPAGEQAGADLVAACKAREVPEQVARAVASILRGQERYTFCGAHAVALARTCWRLALFKARHPVAFWLAALNHLEGHFGRWVYVECVKRAGVAVLPPCVNRSKAAWTQEVSCLRAGLDQVRGLDGGAVAALLEARDKGGPFADLADFRRRVTLSPHSLGALVRAGAFDRTGRGREALLAEAGTASAGVPRRAGSTRSPGPPPGRTARPRPRCGAVSGRCSASVAPRP